MKEAAGLAAIAFSVVLAYVIGIHLTESAMAVVIGVMFGVAASIPTSILLILALRQTHGPQQRKDNRKQCQEPIIVVMPPSVAGAQQPMQAISWAEGNRAIVLASEEDVL